jgi:hypothetical protein
MELIKVKKVKVGNLEFFIRYSNRAFLAYTNTTKKEPDNIDVLFHYYYDLAKNGAKAEGKEFGYTYEEFCDAIDPYPEAFPNFNAAIFELFSKEEDTKKKKPLK